MTGQKLVSKTEFARLMGITQGAVTKQLAKSLGNAMVGKRIDLNHVAAQLYVAKKTKRDRALADKDVQSVEALEAAQKSAPRAQKADPTAKRDRKRAAAKVKPRGKHHTSSTATMQDDDNNLQPPSDAELAKFGDMKLSAILRKFGTLTQFKDLLVATKLIEDIHAKRIANAKASGDLVSREHVHKHVFGALEAFNVRLIQDSPRTIVARVISSHESGETLEECEIIVRDLQSTQIRGMKKEVTKGLKSS